MPKNAYGTNQEHLEPDIIADIPIPVSKDRTTIEKIGNAVIASIDELEKSISSSANAKSMLLSTLGESQISGQRITARFYLLFLLQYIERSLLYRPLKGVNVDYLIANAVIADGIGSYQGGSVVYRKQHFFFVVGSDRRKHFLAGQVPEICPHSRNLAVFGCGKPCESRVITGVSSVIFNSRHPDQYPNQNGQDLNRLIIDFCREQRSVQEIMDKFCFDSRTSFRRKYLIPYVGKWNVKDDDTRKAIK